MTASLLKKLVLAMPAARRWHETYNRTLYSLQSLEGDLMAVKEQQHRLQRVLEAQVAWNTELREVWLGHGQGPAGGTTEASDAEGRRRRELAVCNAFSKRCVYVIGFARTSTTITQQMLNTDPRALILGEANFFLAKPAGRFHDHYNATHVGFRNQVSKSSHVPDFVPEREHSWWEWLEAAAGHYAVLGDKMAFSSYHINTVGGAYITSFFEARFFDAKYILLLRNPIDMLLSAAKLMAIVDDKGMMKECLAWLSYVQLWSDWVRTFPHTLTLIADEIDARIVPQLEAFTGLSLRNAAVLLDERNKRAHQNLAQFPCLLKYAEELNHVFELAKLAKAEGQYWQVVQKRSLEENEARGALPGQVAMVPRALGQVWASAERLREQLHLELQLPSQKQLA